MAKFCGKCGTKLDEGNGLCPKCNPGSDKSEKQLSKKEKKQLKKQQKKQSKKEKRKAKRDAMSVGQKIKQFFLKLLLMVCLLGILAGGITVTLVYFEMIDIPVIDHLLSSVGLKEENDLSEQDVNMDDIRNNEWSDSEPYEVTPPDADAYFASNSNIISEISATDSDAVFTEAEACDILAARGFGEYPITTEYSMEGEYFEAAEISDSSSTEHPIYQTYYVTENEDIWTIFIINGTIMANPVSYNVQSDFDVQTILSESNTVMSYDSTTNKFYETIPKESELRVKTVSRIAAGVLDELSIGAIDGL